MEAEPCGWWDANSGSGTGQVSGENRKSVLRCALTVIYAAQTEFLHLDLKALAADLKLLRGSGNVSGGLFERPRDEFPFKFRLGLSNDVLHGSTAGRRERRDTCWRKRRTADFVSQGVG